MLSSPLVSPFFLSSSVTQSPDVNNKKSLKYPKFDLITRHWTDINIHKEIDESKNEDKNTVILAQSGGMWGGKGSVFRHPDNSIDNERNKEFIQALIDAQTIRSFGQGSKFRQRDLRPSFYDDSPNLNAKSLPSQLDWPPETVSQEIRLRHSRELKSKLHVKEYPLLHDAWEEALRGYPNTLEVALFLDSLRNGVCAYYDGQRSIPVVTENYELTPEQWETIITENDKDISAGNNIGWFTELPFPNAHVHPLGLTAKKEDGRKVGDRPLIDPRSVNEHTTKIFCPTTPWDDHLEMIHLAGKGGKISKEDLVAAFKNFFYREQDEFLFCFFIPGKGYAYCKSLNFGARANPPLYDRLPRLASWVFRNKCYALHNTYHVDDHLFYFPSHVYQNIHKEPIKVMQDMLHWSAHLGIVLAEKKRVWLQHIAVVTGILVNLTDFTLGITDNRKKNILTDLEAFFDLQTTTKHKLEILLGSLTFISKVAPAIRPLLNRIIHAGTTATKQHAAQHRKKWEDIRSRNVFVRLSTNMKEDIKLIHKFVTQWNGTEPILDRNWHPTSKPYLNVASTGGDACLTGFAGVFGAQWFSNKWNEVELLAAKRKTRISMPYLELLVQRYIVATWRHEWKGKNILLSCDCEAAVQAINNGLSQDEKMSELVRAISVDAMLSSCDIKAIWIPGDINEPADSLSRFSLSSSQIQSRFSLYGQNKVEPKGRMLQPLQL